MIKWEVAELGEPAFINLQNLSFVHFATKNKMLVLVCHSTRTINFLSIELKRGQQLTFSVNQPGGLAYN